MLTNDSKLLTKLSERRHPKYKDMKPHWDFMELCYEGGRQWFSGNIFQYHKEGKQEYRNRVKRAYRFNHTRECVDLVNKYLFRSPISRNTDDAPKALKAFWEDADRRGLDIDEFIKVASTKSSIFGRSYVVVDSTQVSNDEVQSLADEEKSEAQIYAYVVSPLNVLDMSWDEQGRLNWVLIREMKRQDTDPLLDSGDIQPFYRLWTRHDWYLIDAGQEVVTVGRNKRKKTSRTEAKIIDQGTHGLGEVPVIPYDHVITRDKWCSPAMINDIAYLDRACANYASNLDAIIQDQTFSQLAMPAQNLMPGDEAYDKLLELGTKRVFIYDGEGGKGPEFLSPDPRQAELIIAAIQQLINEIYHSVGLAGERTKQDNSSGIDNSSGVAKSKDFERVNALLISKADSLERLENRIARLVCLWAGETPPETDLVEFSDSFDVRGLFDEFDIATKLSLIQAPPSLRGEQMKSVVDKLFPSLGKSLKQAMYSDVQKWQSDLQEMNKIEMDHAKQSPEEKSLSEEGKRNRDASGSQQSKTKSRQEKRQKEGQAKGRKE